MEEALAESHVRPAVPGRRWKKLLYPVVRFVRRFLLLNQRDQVKLYWPTLRGRDLNAATLAFVGMRFHASLLPLMWGNAHRLRRRAARQPLSQAAPSVMHVTGSFDVGGTQKQILNVCTAPTARLQHSTIELFPELNFLYRRGITLDRNRYVTGGFFARGIGILATHVSTRSLQLVQAYKLFRDFEAERPDVVVGWGHEVCATTFLAAALAGVPRVVFCIRTFNPTFGWTDPVKARWLLAAHRRMTPLVDAVITNSTPLRDDHARWLGIDPATIDVCANGVDTTRLSNEDIRSRRHRVRRQLDIADDVPVAINVGRFSAEKGQVSIIELSERMRQAGGRSPTWLLCGDGPTLEPLRARAQAAGLTNVLFLGRTDAVTDYLCASDLFVMPSDFEGMPNAMMEAMACALPCVSTDRSGAIDVARHGQEALFYQVGDLAAMERHVRHLLDHPDDARAMGWRAQQRLAEFSTERSLRRFEEIIESATTPDV